MKNIKSLFASLILLGCAGLASATPLVNAKKLAQTLLNNPNAAVIVQTCSSVASSHLASEETVNPDQTQNEVSNLLMEYTLICQYGIDTFNQANCVGYSNSCTPTALIPITAQELANAAHPSSFQTLQAIY